jgi:hypothetical protein
MGYGGLPPNPVYGPYVSQQMAPPLDISQFKEAFINDML